MSHDKYGLWRLGVTHVLNAAHGKMCCKGSDDFYGTTVKYYGVAANDLPTFDISPFFYPSAQFIHHALSTDGGITGLVFSLMFLNVDKPFLFMFNKQLASSI